MKGFVLLGALILLLFVTPVYGVSLGDGVGKQWDFELIQEDADVFTTLTEFNETVLELTLDRKPGVTLPGNYKWNMALCNTTQMSAVLKYMNEDAQGGFNFSTAINVNYGKLTDFGMPSTWCQNETVGFGYVLFSGGTRKQLPEHFRLVVPNQSLSFVMYTGSGTEVILGGAGAAGIGESQNERIIRDSYGLHILYRDTNSDLVYYNSTDNSTFNTQVIVTGTVLDVNAVQDSNGNIHVFYQEAGGLRDIRYINKTSAGVWGTAQIVMDLGPNTNELGMMSWAIDSKNGIHGCIVTAFWNGSTTNEFLIYINYSASQGWWGDNTVVNGTTTSQITYNGTWVNSNAADDTDDCDIEVDTNDNVYIVAQGSDQTDLDIWSNRDTTNTTRGGFDQRYQIDGNGGVSQGVSISISPRYNTLHIAYANGTTANTDMSYANNTAANWNTSWTTYTLDTATSGNPSIKVSHDMNVFIVYENTTTNTKELLYANSTVNATSALDWTNRSTLKPRQTWQNGIEPSARGSTFPRRNSVNDSLEFIYWNDTDNNLYFDQLAILFNPLVAAADDLSFTIYVPANNATGRDSESFTQTDFIIFNATSTTATKINPYVLNGGAQTSTVSIFRYENTGNQAINITMNFTNAVPSAVTVKAGWSDASYQASCTVVNLTAAGSCVNISVGGASQQPLLVANLTVAGAVRDVWIWADYNSYAVGSDIASNITYQSEAG